MGPLKGYKIIEIAGLGPGPFCAMLLADMGAEVIRIDRKMGGGVPLPIDPKKDLYNRSRKSIAMDLKNPQAIDTILTLCEQADAIIEGFRPGVMERLGLGPEACLARNPKLVYGRMTGWGQHGALAHSAGHDINYMAISGTLSMIGRKGSPPVPPSNLVADMGGGGLTLAFGITCAMLEATRSGQGQVIDAAMTEGAAQLSMAHYGLKAMGLARDGHGNNLGDTAAHFYEVYETRDGKYFSVGAIEPHFYTELLKGLGLDQDKLPKQMDASAWQDMKTVFAAVFKTKTRDEWSAIFEGTDACASPVLTPAEVANHPHNKDRGSFVDVDGIVQPAPAPRFSRTPAVIQNPPPGPGEQTDDILTNWGFSDDQITALKEAGAV
jgi:alpha-methylacyl-CoA racemase